MQNIVILVGNLGADPESRTTQGGTNITSIRLATSRPRYKDGQVVRDAQGRREQDTEWHRVTIFNGLGETVQKHCTKGMKLLVRGRIHYTEWNDREGVKRYGCEIIAETVDFLDRGKPAQNGDGNTGTGAHNDLDDDVPF